MSKKRNDKEFMICLTPKPCPHQKKKVEIIGVSLWAPSSPDLNPLNYAIWSVLESKTNATSHSNICLLKKFIAGECQKMSE